MLHYCRFSRICGNYIHNRPPTASTMQGQQSLTARSKFDFGIVGFAVSQVSCYITVACSCTTPRMLTTAVKIRSRHTTDPLDDLYSSPGCSSSWSRRSSRSTIKSTSALLVYGSIHTPRPSGQLALSHFVHWPLPARGDGVERSY